MHQAKPKSDAERQEPERRVPPAEHMTTEQAIAFLRKAGIPQLLADECHRLRLAANAKPAAGAIAQPRTGRGCKVSNPSHREEGSKLVSR